MNPLLSRQESFDRHRLSTLARQLQDGRQSLFFGSAKATQHIIGRWHTAFRPANAHPHPTKVCSAKQARDVTKAVVAGVPATKLQANNARL